jgi:membrane protein
LPGTVKRLVARIMGLRAVRTLLRYSEKHGELLAGGLSVTAIFSAFAAIYVGFALIGLFLESNPALLDAVVNTLSTAVPGLIDTGGGGAINLKDLFATKILGWSSILALVAVLVTALSWFSSARDAIRAIFELPGDKTFFLLLKLKDLGFVAAFGAVIIASAALSVLSTSALNFLFGVLGIGHTTLVAVVVARAIGLAIALLLDTVILASLFRVLASVQIPWRRLLPGSLLGGIAFGVLKVLGAVIIGGTGRNPLLASFAAILGLLIWFNLINRVLLLSASWISVDMADHGESAVRIVDNTVIAPPPRRLRPRRTRPVGRAR